MACARPCPWKAPIWCDVLRAPRGLLQPPDPRTRVLSTLDPRLRNVVGDCFKGVCRWCCFGCRDKAPGQHESQKPDRDACKHALRPGFFLSPEGKPSGRRPMAALPRRGVAIKYLVACKASLRSVTCFLLRLQIVSLIPIQAAIKQFAVYETWVTFQLRNTRAMKNTRAGPGHGGGSPPARIRLRIREKGRINRVGKLAFPIGFPAFSLCPGAVKLSRTQRYSGTQV